MKTNNSTHWAIGCNIIPWRINTQVHQTLKRSPFHPIYRMNPCVGISNLTILENILITLVSEAELNDVIAHLDKDVTSRQDAVALAEVMTDTAFSGKIISKRGCVNPRFDMGIPVSNG
jgi:hypothetical protein